MAVEKLKPSEKANLIKTVVLLVTTAVAILIFSLTVGRELYYGERNESLISFVIINFSGYLFFLLMPVEMAFIYYLPNFPDIKLIGAALVTAFLAQLTDYLIGRSFSLDFLCNLISKKKILKGEVYIQKYGNLTIFLFNLLPLSSPIIALVAGILRYRFRDLIYYSLAGLILKYVILSLIF